ncbi:MAG: flagellar FlbD family protein [Chitinispirillales bacterium]|nr:flagellar FlbD family protein [Chitinispirillales bacterium]
MIALQRLNGEQFVLNSDLIESIESTPDTIIIMSNSKKLMVSNSIEDIVRKVVKFRQLCGQTLQVVNKQTQAQTQASGQ